MLAKKVAQRNKGTQHEALRLLKKWHKGTPQYEIIIKINYSQTTNSIKMLDYVQINYFF